VEPEIGPQHHSTGLRNLEKASEGAPLKDEHFRICIKLAQALERFSRNAGHRLPPQLSLPDENRVMRPVSQLYFTNAELSAWLGSNAVPPEMHVLHEELTSIAAQLHVRSLRELHEVNCEFLHPRNSHLTHGKG
jgi:hypothetical protein